MPTSKSKRRVKKAGIIYFAVNNRLANIVKIGATIKSAEDSLKQANRKNEFMPGIWDIRQKIRTNDVERTMDLAHNIYREYLDKESISKEMYFIPRGVTVKQMADVVREQDKQYQEHLLKEEEAKKALEKAQAERAELLKNSKKKLFGVNVKEINI